MRDPANGILYVFYDDNQRVYHDRSPIPIETAPYVLNENCRNTRRVFDVVGCFIHPDFHLYEHDLYVEYWGRDDPEYVESRRFKEGVYERLAAQRGVHVLRLEAGDVEDDVFMEKVRTVTDDNRGAW